MDAKKRIDKILSAVHEQVAEEIKVLLGVEFSLGDSHNDLVSKEKFFDSVAGKQVVARIDLAGEVEGVGCLVIGIKDAIRLGGTLIMLPDSELEEVVGREEYTGETEDSYGEIANIVAGAYTKTFEEMHSNAFRFVRKAQQVVIPVKVDIAGPEPIPDQPYYQVSCSMKLEGRQMGDIHMLMPAAPLGLLPKEKEVAEPPQVESSEPVASPTDEATESSIAAIPEPPEAVIATSSIAEDVASPQTASAVPRKPGDAQKNKKRIDKLLELCEKKLGEDLSSLLGVEVKFSEIDNRLISKEDLFFEELQRKQVVTDMEIVGDLQGKSYFFTDLKDAIQLGGILIMLPPTELENVVIDEDFGEDARDAFGEVANIISGVYTLMFEEQYPEKIRFIKKGMQQVVPLKVDVASDEPCPDLTYYMSSMSLTADGDHLGRVRMLLPASLFQLDAQPEQAQAASVDEPAAAPKAVVEKTEEPQAAPVVAPADERKGPPRDPKFDVGKHRKRVDKLLKECRKKMQEEVGALLGAEVTFTEMENRHITKEEFFFDVASGKQVVTNFDVVGELEDKSYLFLSLKDAIHLGGVLIMLPPAELESVVVDEEFSEDSRDAFGEIANIISGVYTAVFEEQYLAKIRFVKNELGVVVPMKVDIDSGEPIPDVEYYMSTMSLGVEGHAKGKVHLLFPAEMLMLDSRQEVMPEPEPVQPASPPREVSPTVQHVPVDILVISDDEFEAARLVAVAEKRGFTIRQVSFKDNIKNAITQELKAVYIVMREVNEQAFGIAIKISSSCSLPLIAAGPDWTRSRVIKAVKYGVNDILLTPASAEDIQENLENNLVQMAA
ncbi:hypothetical protein [Desulfopila aestuarii]|uniref:Chemotaxis phosphatase CheX n=1 Tax=Desulfopila aestuarii DSM 18488 TaxID=1121416 RepID=A0A1M7YDI9_9BACT|nr:hypothetical protein [Desulfopila aestuarii]SHO50695.1 hypothetical protein SAMN02745220_03596 [Desulfopila aestuarii DSM 18488]